MDEEYPILVLTFEKQAAATIAFSLSVATDLSPGSRWFCSSRAVLIEAAIVARYSSKGIMGRVVHASVNSWCWMALMVSKTGVL